MRLAPLLLVACAGCLLQTPLPPPPVPMMEPVPPPPPPSIGSLWHPELAANYPVLDVRAHFPGDVLTVTVLEKSSGKKDGTTTASAASTIAANVQDFFGVPASAVKILPSGFNPESIIKATTARDSKGDASTERNGDLTASITVTVQAVEPNGNMRVRGDKVIRVNREDEYIVLSGVVRPEDIASDNSVLSSRLADARIEYFGRGVVDEKQNVPFVHRLYDWIWPF